MIEYAISVGANRKAKNWQETKLTWEQLVERLSAPIITSETIEEYLHMDRTAQCEAKDVGGFVGGKLIGGVRRSNKVMNRTLLTLDIDNCLPDDDTLEQVSSLGCRAIVYSTHSHTPRRPRYRLVIPLRLAISRVQYEALGRSIADCVGIERFDDSTYQPERLMYWPSRAADAEYVFQVYEGTELDGEQWLAEHYTNWNDARSWPRSVRDRKAYDSSQTLPHSGGKVQDPTTKGGNIGAFCQCYSIHDAIAKFLPTEFVQEDPNQPDRYTYAKGSSSCGAIVYDNKWLYSHHATDPYGRQLLNAYDLVRLHLYGDRDTHDDLLGKQVDQLPSFKAMQQLCDGDSKVREIRDKERRAQYAEAFFSNTDNCAEDAADKYQEIYEELTKDKNGTPIATEQNILLILREDLKLIGKNVVYDDFSKRCKVMTPLAWDKPDDFLPRDWTDTDEGCLRVYVGHNYRIRNKGLVSDCAIQVLQENKVHRVRDYITSLKWDGVERVDRLFVDTLGAADTMLYRMVTRKALLACVARIMKPGCKFDQIITLVGKEGIGKSTLLSRLGKEWFSDSLVTVEGRDAMESIQGSWIIEVPELQGFKRSEVTAIKAFVSKTEDRYRAAYGRNTITSPRECVFFATTNEQDFLRDANGNRRFWVIQVGTQPIKHAVWDLDDDYIDQVWAEAYHIYLTGESLMLSYELSTEMTQKQAEVEEENSYVGVIEEYLSIPLPKEWYTFTKAQRKGYIRSKQENTAAAFGIDAEMSDDYILREYVSAVEVLEECFGLPDEERNKSMRVAINKALKRIVGWEQWKLMRTPGYGPQRVYRKKGFNE